MKKFIYALMALAAITVVSCKKNNAGDEGDDETKIATATYRIKTMFKGGPDGDLWSYTWNSDGTIAKVELAWNHEVWGTATFTYNGKTAVAKNEKDDDKVVYEIELNDQKLATKITNYGGKEFGSFETLECSYDKNGFLTMAKVNGKLNTLQVIDEEGNIEWWGRIGIADQVTEATTAPGWRKKMHTYYGNVNAGGVHGEWDEDTAAKRWFYETGLLGRASAHIMRTAWWYGVVSDDKTQVKPEYATSLAYYPLQVDANNCVIKETKQYDKVSVYEADPANMKSEGDTEFTFEKIQ